MILRVGELTVNVPEAEPMTMKTLIAFDPVFDQPVAQILIPKGEQSVLIGNAIADRPPGESGLVVPDIIPPEDMRRGE